MLFQTMVFFSAYNQGIFNNSFSFPGLNIFPTNTEQTNKTNETAKQCKEEPYLKLTKGKSFKSDQ